MSIILLTKVTQFLAANIIFNFPLLPEKIRLWKIIPSLNSISFTGGKLPCSVNYSKTVAAFVDRFACHN
ncbi:hypothetical protein CK516_34100 [Nostoc sp. 'Peltigera malacea cyanobiont' DB3992]|nr:hypothetical protein CK516_34100 [Nostoc sp. 'Peltigera malacea cyanobiont' DB3992]